MSNDCPRFGKWIGGCRFEPRYDETLPGRLTEVRGRDVDMINALKDRAYVKDVCVRCGRRARSDGCHHCKAAAMTREQFIDIWNDAAISCAINPRLHKERLPPALWEDLRLRLQGMYRLATGEEHAVIVVTDGEVAAPSA